MRVEFIGRHHPIFVATCAFASGCVRRVGRALLLLAALTMTPAVHGAEDLGARYPATLDFSPDQAAYDVECREADVWRLSSFRIDVGEQLSIVLGPSQVAFGTYAGNALWAAVLPETPGRIETAPAGGGEHVRSIWLRFHPAQVAELFPAETVEGRGDAAVVGRARRLAHHKLRSSWHVGGRPMIPLASALIVDCETVEGRRRFYAVTLDAAAVAHAPAFDEQPIPAPTPLTADEAASIFNQVWSSFDTEYAMFVLRPAVDWTALRDRYQPEAQASRTTDDLAFVLASMLAALRDEHANVTIAGRPVVTYRADRTLNASAAATQRIIGNIRGTRSPLAWGMTTDEIGYINVQNLLNDRLPDAFDDALDHLADTRALIIDLRFNGGGNEMLARAMAGRFLEKQDTYSFSQFRTGPRHTDLSPLNPRTCPARGPWRYRAPVIVLQGQMTFSSAESFVAMLSLAGNVTTMGAPTAGSSGNPRQLNFHGDLVVALPRWVDYGPNRMPIDGVGLAPDVTIAAMPTAFTTTADPVLSAALEALREDTRKNRDD